MKKISVLLLTIIMILQIPVLAYANTDESVLDSSKKIPNDIQTISYIEKTIDMNKNDIKVLKNKGVFDEFLDEVSVEMDKYVSLNSNEVLNQISKWGISPKCTVSDIEIEAQKYLNKYFNGIKIGSNEFKEMVHKYIDNEDMGSRTLADENHEFAPLYLYMCVYSAYILDEEETSIQDYSLYNDKSDIKNLLISDIAYADSQEDFVDTISPQILNKYVQIYAANSSWPKMNGSRIQSYAQKYAISYNTNYIGMSSDCTNFVSQALYYGSLPMTYNASDKSANGYVETTSRWFHFKTNASKYSISTSWIRVVELYDYLSPHYAVYETSSGSNMTPYLNKGFLLQGKPLIGKYKHSVIVTINNGNVQYCAHSSDRKNESIQTFYNGFSKYRVVQTY